MEYYILSADTLGVRSFCTLVKVGSTRIIIDPSAALAPRRFGLPPTEEELLALEICREKIREMVAKSDIIVVTHYHFDHFTLDPRIVSLFKGKIVYHKDISKDIHTSGKIRGSKFLKMCAEHGAETIPADGIETDVLQFSKAVWHGPVGSKVGKVLMVRIKDLVFTSDIQGVASKEHLDILREWNPKIVLMDGFPTNFIGWRVSKKAFEESVSNLTKLIESTDIKELIMDHHIVRDPNWYQRIGDVIENIKSMGVKVTTVSEHVGKNPLVLENIRREIHSGKIKVDIKKELEDYWSKLELP